VRIAASAFLKVGSYQAANERRKCSSHRARGWQLILAVRSGIYPATRAVGASGRRAYDQNQDSLKGDGAKIELRLRKAWP
jgi:hypothetical protein